MDYVYDLAGKIKQVTDPTGTYAMAYDNMGRLIGTTTTYSFLPAAPFTNSYVYDLNSNRTQLSLPDGSTETYAYDTLNRLSSITDSLIGIFNFGYDNLSRRTSLTRPNGVNTSYGYDSLSHLLSVLHQNGTNTLDGATYIYDPAGNRTSKTNLLNNITEQYTYDALYQLTLVVASSQSSGATTTESYSYDAVGNRLSSLGMSYNYNTSNELTSTTAATYTYDANGNTLTKANSSGTTQYGWDFENRLKSVITPGGTMIFAYDPFGRRIQKTFGQGSSTTVINYVYNGMSAVEEIDANGNVLAHYTHGAGIDEPLVELRSGSTAFYQQDGLGSVTSLSNSPASLTNSYAYDTFGNITASSGSFVNPYLYTARDFDPETGLRYYRARYYSPDVGRFVSEDPIGFDAGNNFYRYVTNSPTNLFDPTGNDPCLNVLEFVYWLDHRAKPKGTGHCAQFFRRALEKAGFDTTGHPDFAKDYGQWLLQNGFSEIPTDNYTPQIGDTVVFQDYPNQDPPAGHIQAWDGVYWVSDFIQPPHGIYPGPPYRKGKVPYAIYRPTPCQPMEQIIHAFGSSIF